MKFGAMLMPSHPPEQSIRDGQRRDLEELERLDRLGFEEAWIGEHFTASWEPCPAPDLLIAQALMRTKRINLGPLGHLLPYHNPVELAHRIAYLDHLAEGRYKFGVGVSALPSDHELFGLDPVPGVNRRMSFESLEIMTSLWTSGPTEIHGEFWKTGRPKESLPWLGYHLKPYQHPHPPIAIAGLTPDSKNLMLAGRKGYIPVSFCISPDARIIARHWEAVEQGAVETALAADRGQWRIIRDVYVARTDDEARERALGGMMGTCWREFLLPLYLALGLGPLLKTDPRMADEDITLEYLAQNLWIVGSVKTVSEKIMALYDETGGFGYLIMMSYDAGDEEVFWERNLSLLINHVLPACSSAEITRRNRIGARL